MRLVRLSDGCLINPEDVQDITVRSSGHGDVITVRMRNGIGHSIFADHGKSTAETLARLKSEIEATR